MGAVIITHVDTRKVLLLAGIAGLILFVYFIRQDLLEAVDIIRGAQWHYLLLILPLQAFSYLAMAMFFRKTLTSIGAPKIPVGRLYGLSVGVTFTNAVFPSASASGISLMAATLRRDGVSSGQSAFVQLARFGIITLTYIFLLLFALAMLYFGGAIARIAVRIVVLLLGLILVTAIVGGYVLYDKRGFDWMVKMLQRFVDWISRKFRNGKEFIGNDRIERALGEFHNGLHAMVRRRDYMKSPLIWGFLNNIVEVATLYAVFLALGFATNPGVVILAYAVANAVGILSVVPGDIGVFEASMVAILSISGIPLAASISATVLYRVINKAILLPLGLYFYNYYTKEATSYAAGN